MFSHQVATIATSVSVLLDRSIHIATHINRTQYIHIYLSTPLSYALNRCKKSVSSSRNLFISIRAPEDRLNCPRTVTNTFLAATVVDGGWWWGGVRGGGRGVC